MFPLLPRSLLLPPPHRGRSLRHFTDRIPGLRFLRLAMEERKRLRLAAVGRLALAAGAPEGRRYLTTLPHQFCGIGHSSSEWNTAYQWAPLLGLEHVNTPMREPWASLLGFGAGSLKWTDLVRTEKPLVVRLPYIKWAGRPDGWKDLRPVVDSIRSPRNLLFVLADGQNSYDQTANAEQQRADFRTHGRWQHLRDHREAGRLNVAVHIRRGDVAGMKARGEGNWQERYVDPQWFGQVMAKVAQDHRTGRPLFHLYSQGAPEEFEALVQRFEVRLHLNVNEQETLFNMSQADLLVMSPSGFSYLAAILSEGRKIARTPWWHHLPASDGWLLVSGDCSAAHTAGQRT